MLYLSQSFFSQNTSEKAKSMFKSNLGMVSELLGCLWLVLAPRRGLDLGRIENYREKSFFGVFVPK
jgi:hypothetical protein